MATREAREKNVQPLKTQPEIEDMKYMLRRNPTTGKRDEFLFKLGIATGLRISHLVKLKVKDVRNQRTLKIKEKKTQKVRDVYLELAYDAIDEYTKGMANDVWLFSSRKGNKPISETQAYRILVSAGESLGREDIGTHNAQNFWILALSSKRGHCEADELFQTFITRCNTSLYRTDRRRN